MATNKHHREEEQEPWCACCNRPQALHVGRAKEKNLTTSASHLKDSTFLKEIDASTTLAFSRSPSPFLPLFFAELRKIFISKTKISMNISFLKRQTTDCQKKVMK